jgi:hypothetical protein
MHSKKPRSPRRAAGVFFALLFFWALPASAAESTSLVLSDHDGTRLFSAVAEPGDRFSIVFTHSLMLSRVEEVFEATPDGRFRLVETRYEDFGAGLPYEEQPGQKMRFENGQIILDGYTAVFPHLWIRVGHIADHRLVTPAGETVHLNTLTRPGAAVKIRIETRDPEGNND